MADSPLADLPPLGETLDNQLIVGEADLCGQYICAAVEHLLGRTFAKNTNHSIEKMAMNMLTLQIDDSIYISRSLAARPLLVLPRLGSPTVSFPSLSRVSSHPLPSSV